MTLKSPFVLLFAPTSIHIYIYIYICTYKKVMNENRQRDWRENVERGSGKIKGSENVEKVE